MGFLGTSVKNVQAYASKQQYPKLLKALRARNEDAVVASMKAIAETAQDDLVGSMIWEVVTGRTRRVRNALFDLISTNPAAMSAHLAATLETKVLALDLLLHTTSRRDIPGLEPNLVCIDRIEAIMRILVENEAVEPRAIVSLLDHRSADVRFHAASILKAMDHAATRERWGVIVESVVPSKIVNYCFSDSLVPLAVGEYPISIIQCHTTTPKKSLFSSETDRYDLALTDQALMLRPDLSNAESGYETRFLLSDVESVEYGGEEYQRADLSDTLRLMRIRVSGNLEAPETKNLRLTQSEAATTIELLSADQMGNPDETEMAPLVAPFLVNRFERLKAGTLSAREIVEDIETDIGHWAVGGDWSDQSGSAFRRWSYSTNIPSERKHWVAGWYSEGE